MLFLGIQLSKPDCVTAPGKKSRTHLCNVNNFSVFQFVLNYLGLVVKIFLRMTFFISIKDNFLTFILSITCIQ